MKTNPIVLFDEDSGRFSILCVLKHHPLALNTYKSEAEAREAWRLWHLSVKPLTPKPSRPAIPSFQTARKRGVCMQCLGNAGHLPRQPGYRWHSKIEESELPLLEACGMNLCPRCYAVHQKSIAAGLKPSAEVPFELGSAS